MAVCLGWRYKAVVLEVTCGWGTWDLRDDMPRIGTEVDGLGRRQQGGPHMGQVFSCYFRDSGWRNVGKALEADGKLRLHLDKYPDIATAVSTLVPTPDAYHRDMGDPEYIHLAFTETTAESACPTCRLELASIDPFLPRARFCPSQLDEADVHRQREVRVYDYRLQFDW